jgi:hypothetical protein
MATAVFAETLVNTKNSTQLSPEIRSKTQFTRRFTAALSHCFSNTAVFHIKSVFQKWQHFSAYSKYTIFWEVNYGFF